MKALLRKAIIIGIQIILLSHVNLLFAQTDSLQIRYSQEPSDSSDYNYHRKYEYLNINLKDETKMFKIAIPTFSNRNEKLNNYDLVIEFEKKITSGFSAYLDDYLSYSDNTQLENRLLNFFLGIRYYFLKHQQINYDISGNNVNGLYIDLSSSIYNHYQDFFSDYSPLDNFFPDLKIGLGIQKRLNNWSFLDALAYYSPYQSNIGLCFKIGFAWGWK